LLVIATHVPLGQYVLARSIIFIDLAIAQVAIVGVIVAHWLGWEPLAWPAQVAATTAALLGALLLTWTERRWPHLQEALIGTLFVLAASVAVLLLANDPHGGEHMNELLVGQILWVTAADLGPVAILYSAIVTTWFIAVSGRPTTLFRQFGFYGLFALAVTQSVQLVGIYLVFATLIIPALAARSFDRRLRLAAGYGTATAGYGLGILASASLDLPTGPIIVCTLFLASLGTVGMARLHR